MAYEKVNWKDYPSSSTPVNAKNLGKMDDGIADAHKELTEIKNLLNNVANLVFPVGTIIMSTSNVNPGNYIGGSWEAWGTGKVPVGVDGTNSLFNDVEKIGGKTSYARSDMLSAHQHGYSPRGSISKTIVEATSNGANANITVASATASGTIESHRHQNDTRTMYDFEASGMGIVGGSTVRTGIQVSSNKVPRYTEYAQPSFFGSPHQHGIHQTAHAHTINVKEHTHSFSGSLSTTYENGKTGDVEIMPPYETCFMWKRIA